jgi:hypothetical protein
LFLSFFTAPRDGATVGLEANAWEGAMKPSHVMLLEVGDGGIERFDGLVCRYTLVRPDHESAVPYFVGTSASGIHVVSTEVPKKYRRAMIAHEACCFELRNTGHCVEAIDFELNFVPRKDRAEYLQLRMQFFDNLVALYEGREHVDQTFFHGIKQCRDHLHALA